MQMARAEKRRMISIPAPRAGATKLVLSGKFGELGFNSRPRAGATAWFAPRRRRIGFQFPPPRRGARKTIIMLILAIPSFNSRPPAQGRRLREMWYSNM